MPRHSGIMKYSFLPIHINMLVKNAILVVRKSIDFNGYRIAMYLSIVIAASVRHTA